MDAIFNNPFKILGLNPTDNENIISERVSEIYLLLEEGKNVSFPIDQFYNNLIIDAKSHIANNNLPSDNERFILSRTIDNVKNAYEQLQDPVKRKYYSFFAFELDKSFSNSDVDNIVKTWESELQIKETKINKFFYSLSTDFLNQYSEEENTNTIIEKEYNSLKIKNLTESGGFLKPNESFRISQELNFSFEFDCEWIEGDDNNSFSINWGNHFGSYYSFGVSGNGYIFILDIEDLGIKENDKDFIGSKKSDVVNQHGKNHLEVRKNDNCIEFYINNNLVHKTNSYKKFYGDGIGLRVCGKQTIVFSNFKLNYYKSDIDYASDIVITNENFNKIKNLSLYYFTKAFLNNNIPKTYTDNNTDLFIRGYAPTIMRIYLDKALILFGKLFRKDILLSSGFLNSNIEPATVYNFLSQIFLDDLLEGLKTSFENDNGIKYYQLRDRLEAYSNDFIENFYLYSKNQLRQLPADKKDINNKFDFDSFRKTKISKSHFAGTINNPFRVLALKQNATDKEISKRVSDLLVYSEMGKIPKYSTDLFFGEVNRTIENIKDAAKKLDNPYQKLYYSFLWFLEGNDADKDFLEDIRKLNTLENSNKFKRYFIGNAAKFLTEKVNFEIAVKIISATMYENSISVLRDFIDTKNQSESIQFCLHQDITSVLPLNNNSHKLNNQLVLNSNTVNGFWLLKNVYFDKEVDYEIEFDCEWIEGEDDNKLYSIIFGKDVENNYYRFGISANGNLYFEAIVNGISQNIYGWQPDGNINIRAKNKLKVSYDSESKVFNLYINEQLTDELSTDELSLGINALKSPLLGDYIGVSVFGKQKVAFSNLKISYLHFTSNLVPKSKIKSSNITSAINLITSNLCLCSFIEEYFNYVIAETITIFGEILNSECLSEFASKIIGNHRNIDISVIERYFIDDIYSFVRPQLDKGVEVNEFIDAFCSFSNAGQNYVVHKFIGKPVFDIEEAISKTRILLKQTPSEGAKLGFGLFDSTKENLTTVRKILSYTNYQYRLLANNLADAILDCAIVFFNSIRENREATLDEGNQMLKLNNYANTIAIDGNVRKRVDESLEFIQKWISDTTRKEQEKLKFNSDTEQQSNRAKTERPASFLGGELFTPMQKKALKKAPKKVEILKSDKIVIAIVIVLIIIIALIYVSKSNNIKETKNTTTSSVKSINEDIYSVTKEESKWQGNKLKNGASPYDSFFGKAIYDYNSECWLLFKNGNLYDVIVCLEDVNSGRTIRNEYIQAGTNFKMTNLPEGVYKVKGFYGNDWNPFKTINNGKIKGAFDTDLSFSISDNPKDLIKIRINETYEGISYTTGEITLYAVANGNMKQRKINSDEFFK